MKIRRNKRGYWVKDDRIIDYILLLIFVIMIFIFRRLYDRRSNKNY